MHWVTQPGPVGNMPWRGLLEENKWGEAACGAGVRGRKMIGGEEKWRWKRRNIWKLEAKY